MIRFVLITVLLAGCRMTLEDDGGEITGRRCQMNTSSQACIDAASHSDLAWIENNVFTACSFSGCHNGSDNTAGRTDLQPGKSYAHLVNFASELEPTRMHVVPGDIPRSYLMLMVADFAPDMADPPADPPVEYMPKGVPQGLCCQKLDALERWIVAGAPNN